MKIASDTVNSIAHNQSPLVTRRCASRALSGSANSSADTSSGCTTINDPLSSASAWKTKPATAAAVPAHHSGRRSRSRPA